MNEQLTIVDWARLAAFIDGEGCIYISRYAKGRETHPRYQLVIHITNTDPRLLVWLGRFGDACFGIRHIEGQRDRHDWTVASKKAAEILRNCLPHFVMKRDQAELALAFQETKKYWGRGSKVSTDVQGQWADMHANLSEMKTPPFGRWMEKVQ